MMTSSISEIVRNVFENDVDPTDGFASVEKPTSSLEEYKLAVAKRLVSGLKRYKIGSISKIDFELLIRDYLLVFKGQVLRIPDYELSEKSSASLKERT